MRLRKRMSLRTRFVEIRNGDIEIGNFWSRGLGKCRRRFVQICKGIAEVYRIGLAGSGKPAWTGRHARWLVYEYQL
jgi:hypothetical protein